MRYVLNQQVGLLCTVDEQMDPSSDVRSVFCVRLCSVDEQMDLSPNTRSVFRV